jgi:hypothetical protein
MRCAEEFRREEPSKGQRLKFKISQGSSKNSFKYNNKDIDNQKRNFQILNCL